MPADSLPPEEIARQLRRKFHAMSGVHVKPQPIKPRWLARGPFRAWQSCPKCSTFDVHWIELIGPDKLIRNEPPALSRQCRSCAYYWIEEP